MGNINKTSGRFAPSAGKGPQTIEPPPVEQEKKTTPDREQVGMTAQRKKTEQTKKQQKASLTGTSIEDAGKTVLGG